jgi:hypothetical protein
MRFSVNKLMRYGVAKVMRCGELSRKGVAEIIGFKRVKL